MRVVAALYVDPRGIYPTLPGVDCWDESRDARLYAGPFPVVAHPPCGPWGKLRHLCTKQDPLCGPMAVRVAQRFGGVVEHPDRSKLWDFMALPKPGDATDAFGGRTYEVCQVDWGHVARKRTWIYVVGVDQRWVMRRLRERRGVGVATHVISQDAKRPIAGKLRASPQASRRTPRPFAEFLVELARRSALSRGSGS